MSSPLESPEFGSLYVGDARDDDGRVLDSLVQSTDAPATPVVESIAPAPLVFPKPITRIFADTEQMYIGDAPRRLLSEDLKRQTCRVKVYSLNDTAANITWRDFVIISDEKGKVSNGTAGINIVVHHGQSVDLDGHTGALWVIPGSLLTAVIEICAWGVSDGE